MADTYRIEAGGVAREIEVRDGIARTRRLVPAGRSAIEVEGTELVVVLDTADWRLDIAAWRWRQSATAPAGWDDPGTDDADWKVVPTLHPVISARADAPSWFRARIELPAHLEGSDLFVVLGGLDDQDWDRYEVRLDGALLDEWRGDGRIREPRRIRIAPGTEAYGRLPFGGSVLLAVRGEGLSRRHPGIAEGELEHHYFADWLVDQYVAAGEPTRVVDDFRVVEARGGRDGQPLELRLESGDVPGLAATLRYRADGPYVRKDITLLDRGQRPLAILDVVTDRWAGTIEPSAGGRGVPVVIDRIFTGIEHPAGVARTAPGRVELVEMPGVTLEPGGEWRSQAVVLGAAGATGSVDEAVRDHVLGLRPRTDERIRVYSALGWYDFTNPADPLPELNEELVLASLDQLAHLAEGGARFDIYMFDDWWDWEDLGRFRPSAFREGPAASVERLEGLGMRAGLWWATTRAAWSTRDRAGLEPSFANAPDFGASIALAGGEWRWLEEFTGLMIGERRFCLASEPYRTHALESLPVVVGETRAGLLKLDCAVLHCTSSEHGHRAGRHSVAPMVETIIEIVDRCRAVSDDLRVVLYWGFRSPWYLRYADQLFDKGLLMEAATVASSPAPTIRQSLSTNLDQAIRHARFLPLRLQDSLGIWIGDVAWCNRIGKEEWREALLLDLARGSDLVQLWGDLALLDELDERWLGEILGWLEASGGLQAAEPRRLGGDPWRLEPYGYASASDGSVLVTLANPGMSAAEVELPADLGGRLRDGGAWEAYPFPGWLDGDEVGERLVLAPFEVRVLEAVPSGSLSGKRSDRPLVRPTRGLALGAPVLENHAGGDVAAWKAEITLPALENGDEILVVQRLERDGQWSYVPDTRDLLGFDAHLDGLVIRMDTLPRTRDRNGPGSPWSLRRIPAGAAWSGRSLSIDLSSSAAPGTRVHTDAFILDARWRRHRRFEAAPR
jgi:hypothetical protein